MIFRFHVNFPGCKPVLCFVRNDHTKPLLFSSKIEMEQFFQGIFRFFLDGSKNFNNCPWF